MNIILGEEAYQTVKDKYLVLELDTFIIKGTPHTSYCVLDASDIPLGEMPELSLWEDNHSKIIKNYRNGNYDFCEQMIEHATTRWGGHLSSFYTTLNSRIQEIKESDQPISGIRSDGSVLRS